MASGTAAAAGSGAGDEPAALLGSRDGLGLISPPIAGIVTPTAVAACAATFAALAAAANAFVAADAGSVGGAGEGGRVGGRRRTSGAPDGGVLVGAAEPSAARAKTPVANRQSLWLASDLEPEDEDRGQGSPGPATRGRRSRWPRA